MKRQLLVVGQVVLRGATIILLVFWIALYIFVLLQGLIPFLRLGVIWDFVVANNLIIGITAMAAIAFRQFRAGWWYRSKAARNIIYGGDYGRFLEWLTAQGKWQRDSVLSVLSASMSVFVLVIVATWLRDHVYLDWYPSASAVALAAVVGATQPLLSAPWYWWLTWTSVDRPIQQDINHLPLEIRRQDWEPDWIARMFNRLYSGMPRLSRVVNHIWFQLPLVSVFFTLAILGACIIWGGLGGTHKVLSGEETLALGTIQTILPALTGYSLGFVADLIRFWRKNGRLPWTKVRTPEGLLVSSWDAFSRNAVENGVVVFIVDLLAGFFATILQLGLAQVGIPPLQVSFFFFLAREALGNYIGLLFVARRAAKLALSVINE